MKFSHRSVLVASLLAMTCVTGSKQVGLLQPLELTSFDLLTRLQPDQDADPRLLIVAVTESDLEQYGWPLSDRTVASVMEKLQAAQPAVIGLDLYRNTVQPPGRLALEQQLSADNVIGIMNVGQKPDGGEVAAPQALPSDRVGFNDLAIDPDGVLRRNLLFVGPIQQPHYSFALRVVLAYYPDLAFTVDREAGFLQIGETRFPSLNYGSGGYARIDDRGYQVLLKYRTRHAVAQQVSIHDVLTKPLPPEWVTGKIVLIGSTASSLKDEFFTPYSANQGSNFMMSGVEVHAQSISQLLSAVEGSPALYRFLPEWGEFIWLLLWAVAASVLGWKIRRPLVVFLASGSALAVIWGLGGLALTQLWWVPTIEPIAGFILAGALVVTQKALYRSTYDSLTDLPGRDVFLLSIQQALQQQRSQPSPTPVAVVFLDIDRFKLINQSLGHTVGDSVLKSMALRLRQALPETAHLARVGGDEFAFLLQNQPQSVVDETLSQLHTQLAAPFCVVKQRLSITASMGVAIAQDSHSPKPEDLLRDAHTAMYRAKALNEFHYEVFATDMREEAINRLEMESSLLHALENDEFLLHYQPIVRLDTGQIAGFEALVRWQRGEGGFVSPGQFIPIVEETGLILSLGYWIFREACHQLKVWQQQFPQNSLKMSINLSRRQFRQEALVNQISDCLKEFGLNGQSVQLEITESMIMRNVESAKVLMRQLKDLGLQLAIDDFGTGYSSLSYLHKFPTDVLKIDQSFVGRMDNSPEDRAIVHTIITLGQQLNMRLVAEGIESTSQSELLQAAGCHWGQGYLFSKPLNAADATRLLAESSHQLSPQV